MKIMIQDLEAQVRRHDSEGSLVVFPASHEPAYQQHHCRPKSHLRQIKLIYERMRVKGALTRGAKEWIADRTATRRDSV